MDGHDNDNSANDSGAEQGGGIYSTPDLTVDAEKIASPVQSDERKRVALIFANTDTGRQTQRLNDAMEAQTEPATEDLVIRNEKKKSKAPIVLVVVVIVAIIAGLVAWIVLGGFNFADDNKDSSQSSNPAIPLDVAYNSFMNYLVDGKESTKTFTIGDLPEDYSLNNPYSLYAEAVIAGLDGDASLDTYLSEFTKKYEVLVDAYSAANDGDSLGGGIYDYFYEYAGIIKATETDFLQLYLTLGEDATQDLISSRYNEAKYSDALKTYLENQKTIASYQLFLAELAVENGCVVDGAVQTGCMDQSGLEISQEMVTTASKAYLETDSIVLSLRSDAMDAIARIGNQVLEEGK